MKCTIILPKGLPVGLQANTAAILGIAIGKKLPHIVGADVYTADGQCHAGITEYLCRFYAKHQKHYLYYMKKHCIVKG